MEDFVTYIWGENSYWSWWALGAFLFVLEVLLPTFFLIWPALSAIIVGGIVIAIPDMPWETQVIIFTIIAIINTVLGRLFFAKHMKRTDHPTLNQPEQALLGRVVRVEEDFIYGQGFVKVGDARWQAQEQSKRNPKKDDMVEVVSVDGMVLIIR